MNFKVLIKLLAMFLVPFIALSYLLPKYLGLELEGNVLNLVLLSSLIMMGMILLYSKKGHQSQLEQYVGLPMLIIGGLFVLSSVSLNGSAQYIELDARTQAYFIISVIVGFILIYAGIRKSQRSSTSIF